MKVSRDVRRKLLNLKLGIPKVRCRASLTVVISLYQSFDEYHREMGATPQMAHLLDPPL